MIDKKQKEIFNKLNNTDEIKRFKELENQIKNNKEYIKLKEEFDKKENVTNQDIVEYRKKLFEIEGVREYSKLESDIRLFSRETSKIISSIVNKEKC